MGPGQYGYGYPPQVPTQPSFQSFANQQNGRSPVSPQMPQSQLQCRFIDDPSTIMPIDVPTNGDPAFFVARNFSRVIAKAVNNRGTIDEVVYEPVKQQTPEQVKAEKDLEFQNMVIKRFESLEAMLQSAISPKTTEATKQAFAATIDPPKNQTKGGRN